MTARPTPPRSPKILLLCCSAAVLTSALGGCYERVVRAKGLGADRYSVSEPYQESGKVDEWIFGTPARRSSNNTLLPED